MKKYIPDDEMYQEKWGILKKSKIASTVFITYFSPKIQEEAIRYIYNGRDPKNHNINRSPVSKTTKKLFEDNFIDRVGVKNGAPMYQSSIEPVIEYIKSKLDEKKKDTKKEDPEKSYSLTNEEEELLRMILNSGWFRSWIRIIDRYPHNHYCYFEEKRCIVENPLEMVIEMFGYMTTLSLSIGYYYQKNGLVPSINEMISYDSFEDLVNDYRRGFSDEDMDFIYSVIESAPLGDKAKKLYKRISNGFYFLFIPYDLCIEKLYYIIEDFGHRDSANNWIFSALNDVISNK